MFSHIKVWRESRKTQKLYCAEKNIPHSVFQYWRGKFRNEREESNSDDFAELIVGGTYPPDQPHLVHPKIAPEFRIKYA